MNKGRSVRWLVSIVYCLAGAMMPIGAYATAPTIKLFPTTVLEEIRHTGSVAQEMETGLQTVIARLDQQQKLYIDSKCEGAVDDPGCARLAKQMGQTYLEMLSIMEDRLPAMEAAVNSTTDSLERRLRSELGRKMTPWQVQEMLLGKSNSTAVDRSQPSMRGRSGMRLSTRFSQYYQLVARSNSQSGSSLAVIASDIYLDMREASVLIARTREEISRATLMEQLNQSFGTITPEMQAVVSGVKEILFGEVEIDGPASAPPTATARSAYSSPLEL